jgi:hypothetical protein
LRQTVSRNRVTALPAIATQQPALRELQTAYTRKRRVLGAFLAGSWRVLGAFLFSPATISCARLIFAKQAAIKKAGKTGKETLWTLGQALRCSLRFWRWSY